jgi:hypothetical protein
MSIWEWVSQNWFALLSAVGIIGGLWFSALSRLWDVKAQQVANLLTLTANQQKIWADFHRDHKLERVLNESANIAGSAGDL